MVDFNRSSLLSSAIPNQIQVLLTYNLFNVVMFFWNKFFMISISTRTFADIVLKSFSIWMKAVLNLSPIAIFNNCKKNTNKIITSRKKSRLLVVSDLCCYIFLSVCVSIIECLILGTNCLFFSYFYDSLIDCFVTWLNKSMTSYSIFDEINSC